jgi:hypothetical protein
MQVNEALYPERFGGFEPRSAWKMNIHGSDSGRRQRRTTSLRSGLAFSRYPNERRGAVGEEHRGTNVVGDA